ncbi:eukaryotic initiation factor-2b gamma [Cyclospora cayetanensis]|uniref:Translation initiation factor eIF2B subunit gamma n=1 Tax=Cyclospora cayetanensis TaxID=88456 RepID=A0A1D3CR35_9EIME|nr:eukaryotic initiation factor-2b gamma [Cyclospora cayetanensis]
MPPHTDATSMAAPVDASQQKNPFPEFQVVVLAGGSGSRLSSLLDAHGAPGAASCKALLPVANRPMIWYCLRNLQEATFGDVIVVTQAQQQAELSAYLQQEFRSSFRRLEVVGLKCTRRGEDEDGEDSSCGGNRRRSVDAADDPDQRVCGTAEALQQIRHLITTDFIVLSCDLIGHVDFFALATCTVYLMPRDPFAEPTPAPAKGNGDGKKSKGAQQAKVDTSRGNPVTVVLDDSRVQLLALQDRHSMIHGSSLQVSKLHLFLYPSQHLLPEYYDPHVYVFAHATLKILDQPSLRHSLYSIRFDLVPYMITMQMTHAAQVWSDSRLECDVFERQLGALQRQGVEEFTSTSLTATSATHELPSESGLPVLYTAANPPPRPAKGNRVVCCMHPDSAGICCRVNNLNDYREMNNKMRDCVLADGAMLEADVVVKRSVVAKDATLRSGCKVTQSILMSGVEVGPKAVLQRVILCPGAKVGKDCKLVNCQVRGGFCVPDGTIAEDTTLPSFTDGVDFTALHL